MLLIGNKNHKISHKKWLIFFEKIEAIPNIILTPFLKFWKYLQFFHRMKSQIAEENHVGYESVIDSRPKIGCRSLANFMQPQIF